MNENGERCGFELLVSAHDYFWRAPYDLKLRLQVCQLLWGLAIRIQEQNIHDNSFKNRMAKLKEE